MRPGYVLHCSVTGKTGARARSYCNRSPSEINSSPRLLIAKPEPTLISKPVHRGRSGFMFELFTLARTPIGELCWQLGLFLLVGLTASFALGRRPARAHRVLFLAALAGLATPALSASARQTGSGLWPGPTVFENRPVEQAKTHTSTAASVPALRRDDQVQPSMMLPSAAQVPPQATRVPAREQPISMVRILLGVWTIAGSLALLRIGLSLVFGRRIVSRSRPVCNLVLQRAGELASERIGLGVKPDIRFSKSVHSPVIWCWGRRPVILLSQASEAVPDQVDWTGVFCHELAHWVRRDHWSSLVGEILVGIVPWNPLAWACRWRLAQLGELACDDWAIACGQEPNEYAETLVRLLPRRRTAPALAAISRRSGLEARINHIIETAGGVDPWPGRIWSGGAALVAVSLTATLALAQAPAMTRSRQRDGTSKLPSPSRNALPNAQRTIHAPSGARSVTKMASRSPAPRFSRSGMSSPGPR